ncbi:MAG: DNA/RNA non-specific endonuclease [Lachnospiraceae bacterium]|nr:DNA/RNA non-specific endonuclease [Lachnospiraceae bacterium]
MKNKLLKTIILSLFIVNSITISFAGELASQFADKAYISYGNANFTEDEKKLTDAFETYTQLDEYGRCGVAFANICKDIMPTEDRGSIGMIKPSGWVTPLSKYDFIDGKYLYNRCHLIAYELAGENANEKNLITGTRFLNIKGMRPFETKVSKYVRETGNHCLYRVTPIFENDNLLCEGVQIEAYSVEDNGEGINFNVLCFNVQPGVNIDYTTGANNSAN